MGSIVAGFTAAVDPSAAATALTGANIEAENNYLSEQKKAQKNEEIQACKSWACAATVQVKWAAIDAGQDASFYSGVVAGVPAGLYDAVLGIVQAASSPLETYAALKSLFESGDVLERVPEAIKQSYIDRITRMEEEYQRAGADGSFSAGVEGGKLIFDVVSLVTGAAGKSGIVLTERVTAKVAGNAGKVETSGGLLVQGAGKDYVDILSPEAKQHIFFSRHLHPLHLHRSPGSDMSIQRLGRCSILLFLAALSSGCSLGGECGWNRSSCMYEGKYEEGEEDYAEDEAKRLNKNSSDRLRRSSGN